MANETGVVVAASRWQIWIRRDVADRRIVRRPVEAVGRCGVGNDRRADIALDHQELAIDAIVLDINIALGIHPISVVERRKVDSV